MYTEQNPQKAILPRQRVMTSRTIGATGPKFSRHKETIKKEPQVRCELKALVKWRRPTLPRQRVITSSIQRRDWA